MNNNDVHVIKTLTNSVATFSKAADLPLNSGDNCDIETHKSVIGEEFVEFADGAIDTLITLMRYFLDCKEEEKAKVMKSILKVVRALDVCDIDIVKSINKVHAANMSKMCKTDIEVKLTEEKYRDIGVKTRVKKVAGGLFAVYCDEDVTGKDGKFYKRNKLLKNINWHEPDWSDIDDWACKYEWGFLK